MLKIIFIMISLFGMPVYQEAIDKALTPVYSHARETLYHKDQKCVSYLKERPGGHETYFEARMEGKNPCPLCALEPVYMPQVH